MRIVISNARLAVRAGSELATLEVAEAHRRIGHEVAIFTLVRGELASTYTQQSGVPVFGLADRAALADFGPELLHVHHWPTVVTLEWLGIVAPWVIGFLGIHPPLENPPPLLPHCRVPWWTLNPIAEAQVSGIPGWGASPHLVVGNWFDDHGLTPTPVHAPESIRRVLVVSNHFPESTYRSLVDVAAELGIDVTCVGLPGQQAVVDRALLRQFDCVITLGRTALLAMATGTPVLVVDHFGADGWVTPGAVDSMALHNFSGRWSALEPTHERFREWLLHPPSADHLQQVQDWAMGRARLSTVLARLDALYADPCTMAPSQVFGLGSLAVGELLDHVELIRHHDAHHLVLERDQAIAQRDDAVAERAVAIAGRDQAVAEREQMGLLRDDALAQRDALLNSRVWRSMEWYRRLRRRLSI
jgi:hypothetical protein